MKSIAQEHSPVNNANLMVLNTEIRTLDGLYSLNDLHKAAGGDAKHRPNQFLRLDQTKELITEIERCADMRIAIKTKRGGTNQGTFVCKEIVYAYAMWTAPKFHLQVIRSFDQKIQNQLVSDTNKLPELPRTLTPAQQCHLKERMSELVHKLSGNSWQLQYRKLNKHCNVGKFSQILEKDYTKACKFLGCAPQSDLLSEQDHGTVTQSPNMHPMPFMNERITFKWDDGILVESRPMATNEIITTKERVLKLVLAHDFTTVDERVALIEALNADLAQYTKDVMHALKNTRKKRQSMTRIN